MARTSHAGGGRRSSESKHDSTRTELSCRAGASSVTDNGRVIALCGPKAGVGTTVLACNLAVALSVLGEDVILVDADGSFGSVATVMGLPRREVDSQAPVAEGLTEHRSGVRVLTTPSGVGKGAIGDVERSTDHLQRLVRIIARVRPEAGTIVVDTPTAVYPSAPSVLSQADSILFVVTPEVTAILRATAFLQFCKAHGLAERVRVIINRFASDAAIPAGQIDQAFGDRIVARLPSCGPLVLEAVNQGRPFVEAAPGEELSIRVFDLARTMMRSPPT